MKFEPKTSGNVKNKTRKKEGERSDQPPLKAFNRIPCFADGGTPQISGWLWLVLGDLIRSLGYILRICEELWSLSWVDCEQK